MIAKANTPSKSPSGVRHGLCPWWTTLSEFIIFSIQYSVTSNVKKHVLMFPKSANVKRVKHVKHINMLIPLTFRSSKQHSVRAADVD